MPRLDQTPNALMPIRLLLLAEALAGKTHYLAQAAEAGYNLLFIDGDIAMRTIRKLSKEAQSRVFYMPVHDYMDDMGNMVSNFAEFVVKFTTSPKLLWNDSLGRVFDMRSYVAGDGGHEVWQIVPSRIGLNTIIVLDSWTALISSIVQWKAGDMNVDLMDLDKLERDLYTPTGHKATQFLTLLKTLKCHLAITGHPQEYIHRSAPVGSRGPVKENEMKIDWIKMIPTSTSKPHGFTLAKNFSDVGWITFDSMGKRYIDFKPDNGRVIGGNLNDKKSVDEWPMHKLISDIGFTLEPGPPDEWLTIWPNGTYEMPLSKAQLAVAGIKPAAIQSSAAEPKKISLGALAGLKPSSVERG